MLRDDECGVWLLLCFCETDGMGGVLFPTLFTVPHPPETGGGLLPGGGRRQDGHGPLVDALGQRR